MNWKLHCSVRVGTAVTELLYSQPLLQHSEWPSDEHSAMDGTEVNASCDHYVNGNLCPYRDK